MPGRRGWTKRELRLPKRQRIAIVISRYCAKPKNKRTKVCRVHFKMKRKKRR